MKKLISLFLTLVMVFSLAMPVVAAEDTTTIYFDNTEGWSEVYAYVWNDESSDVWPGTAMTPVEGETSLYSVQVPTDAVNVVFNNNDSQTADLTIPTNGRNLYTYSTGEWSVYVSNRKGDVTASYTPSVETVVEAMWGASADSLTESGTFAEALEAAIAPDSTVAYIQLQSNVTNESGNYITSGEFTLDLNGKTLSSSEYTICVRNEGTVVTLTDSATGGAVTTSGEGSPAVAAEDGAKVVIDGGSYSGYHSVMIDGSGSGEIISGTFNATQGYAAANVGTLTITGGTFNTAGYYAAYNAGTLTITGGTFSGTLAAVASSGTTTITGGTFYAGSEGHIAYYDGTLDLSGYNANGLTLSQWTGADLTVGSENILLPEGSTFQDDSGVAVDTLTSETVYIIGREGNEPTYTVTITDSENGTVTADRTAELTEGDTVTLNVTPAEGYELESLTITYVDENGDTRKFEPTDSYTFVMPAADVTVTASYTPSVETVVEAMWGASADSLTESGTFAEALEAAIAPDSTVAYIQLQSNVTNESGNYITSGEFTLDLNGKTLSSSVYTIGVRNEGTVVTLTDTATGGAVTTSGEEYAAVTVSSAGKVVINGGSYSGDPGVLIHDSGSGEIISGTFNATQGNAVQVIGDGTLTITGGTFYSSAKYAAYNVGTLTITGGAFSGGWAAVSSSGTTTITGGTFDKGDEGHIAYYSGTLDLSGYNANGLTLSQWTGANLTVSDENILLPAGSTFKDDSGNAVTDLTYGTVYTIGGENDEPTYTVTITDSENGTVTADMSTAAAGDTVTLSIAPDEGYALRELYIAGELVTVTGDTHTFTMPAADVDVIPLFARSGKALNTLYVKNTGAWASIDVAFYTSSGYGIGDAVTLTLVGGESDIYYTTAIPEFAYKVQIMYGDEQTDVIDLPTDGVLNQYNPDDGTWTEFVATEQSTISANIVWGSMSFTYSDEQVAQADGSTAEKGWTNDATDGGTVTVTNTGETAITATVEYKQEAGYEAINGYFAEGSATASATLPTDDAHIFTLTLSGKPEKALSGDKIGTVTVTIDEAAE